MISVAKPRNRTRHFFLPEADTHLSDAQVVPRDALDGIFRLKLFFSKFSVESQSATNTSNRPLLQSPPRIFFILFPPVTLILFSRCPIPHCPTSSSGLSWPLSRPYCPGRNDPSGLPCPRGLWTVSSWHRLHTSEWKSCYKETLGSIPTRQVVEKERTIS